VVILFLLLVPVILAVQVVALFREAAEVLESWQMVETKAEHLVVMVALAAEEAVAAEFILAVLLLVVMVALAVFLFITRR
jgi:hypothetical protein